MTPPPIPLPPNQPPTPPSRRPIASRAPGKEGIGVLGWIAIVLCVGCFALGASIFTMLKDRAEAGQEVGRWKGRAEGERQRAEAAEQRELQLLARQDSLRRSYAWRVRQLQAADSVLALMEDSVRAWTAAGSMQLDTDDPMRRLRPDQPSSIVPMPGTVADTSWQRRFVQYKTAADSVQRACKAALTDCEKGWALADSARVAADSARAALRRQTEATEKALASSEKGRKVRLLQGLTIGAAACAAITRGLR